MPADPSILFVKPGAILPEDKERLVGAGIIVIEVDDPQAVKFVRPQAELSGSEMLQIAASVIPETSNGPALFGTRVARALAAKKGSA